MAEQQAQMQVAHVLSDLDPAAALALVSVRASPPTSTTTSTSTSTATTEHPQDPADEQDPDLRRATDLVALHYSVRERCKTGALGRELAEARRMVESALGE
ncbi:hypothetical protein OPT61_g7956 [Boeremia exigua]|uniref:Uncharacterized protein n=1 Tax=Boeremia exigua TaxID=749465 RepID=A0ACC2I095_9PLEO|nr:hypothetical protein OPT61_g7956 [Boeremia exigua]